MEAEKRTIMKPLYDVNVTSRDNLVQQAQRVDFWLFDTASKEWFTPEEFVLRYSIDLFERGWYKNIKVLNPKDGLNAADIQIQKIMEKRAVLQEKIIDYYRSKQAKLK